VGDSKIPDVGSYARCPMCENRFSLSKAIRTDKVTCQKCGYQRQPMDDQIVSTEECRGNSETQRGIDAGVRSVTK
jgi:Zn ribbon nucleic-acid-binding protein